MAMLAEPRRKQKYSINPRGSLWSNDENKFGQKLLEKMGWSKGKGLGSQENGRTEHVGIKLKVDKKGVGCTNKFADTWIEHQDDFNDLLACLNQEQNDSDDRKDIDKDQVVSLEKKSEKSKSRVHYMKFTKGKDLSSRSKQDLNCIFGKRKTKKTDKEKVEEKIEEDIADTLKDSICHDHGVKTITNSTSIHEYFALKMKQKRQSLIDSNDNSYQSSPSLEEPCGSPDENTAKKPKRKSVSFCQEFQYRYIEDETLENSETSTCKKMKMCVDTEDGVELDEDVTNKRVKKKSKKRKTENCDDDMSVEEENDFIIHKKKSKKKKKIDNDEKIVDRDETEASEVLTKKSKKKKKRVKENEDNSSLMEKAEGQEENEDNSLMEKAEGQEETEKKVKTKKKSKKRRKEKKEEGMIEEDNVCSKHCDKQQDKNMILPVDTSVDSLVIKKKKKKKLRKKELEEDGNKESEETVTKTKEKETVVCKEIGIEECDHVTDGEKQVVQKEYHAIHQAKLTSDQVKTICTSFIGSNVEDVVGYLNSGPVVTKFYSK